MKKIFIVLLSAVMAVSFFGCSSKAEKAASKADITITEATYVTYINDIYTNPNNYVDKIITIDGMYTYEQYDGNTYYYVFRQGPGCCGNDGSMCGIEFTTEQEYPDYTPKDTDKDTDHPWIKVTGTLTQYYEGDAGPYFTLSNATYEVMPDSERGSSIVSL